MKSSSTVPYKSRPRGGTPRLFSRLESRCHVAPADTSSSPISTAKLTSSIIYINRNIMSATVQAPNGAGDSRDPSGFLSEIIGAPVTVKLNSGVVYKGK